MKRSIETGYEVSYQCQQCGFGWSTVWSCACDDECPGCGRSIGGIEWKLDGTYTQEELDAYNHRGQMPKREGDT